MSETQNEQPVQPLVEHLIELRRRLMWTVVGILVCFF
ncbi:Sec-independent protein translocase subunit TatC, partial [Klebsiella pneumoniae]|nr:Sec-independent protein translocase subunit TatC [Klebsiella pneumoniae]